MDKKWSEMTLGDKIYNSFAGIFIIVGSIALIVMMVLEVVK